MPKTAATTSQAQLVRERFTATLNARIDQVAKFMIAAAEQRVDAYFNEKLEAGLDPYLVEHETAPAVRDHNNWVRQERQSVMTAEIPLFDASVDLASGNNPDVKQAYDVIQGAPREWDAVVERLKKNLEDAGFKVYFGVNDPKAIVLRLHDPKFSPAVNRTLKGASADE